MAITVQLCDRCSQISFAALSCPTEAELTRARKALRKGTHVLKDLPYRETTAQSEALEPRRVNLGSVDRVRQSSGSCQLCAFIYEAITRAGPLPVPKGDELIVIANPDMCHNGFITSSRTDVEGNCPGALFILRRLDILIATVNNPVPIIYFDHIAQPCNVGTMTDEDTKFLFKPSTKDDMWFSGRKRPQMIDFSWLRYWIHTCDTMHSDTCQLVEEQSRSFFLKRIRMVDVRHKCIRTFNAINPIKIKYIALSYVWGTAQTLRLLKFNSAALHVENGLSIAGLPLTVSDAIQVALELGIDYIWVDALCIVQDDGIDMQEQIGSVALIYRSAFFTLIAASGIDCSAGLPGLRRGSRKFTQREVMVVPPSKERSGMSLISTCKAHRYPLVQRSRAEEDVDLSVWNTRGWTLQERVLSRRNLIFTKEQVIWVCDGAYFCEESYFEHPYFEHETLARSADEIPLRWTLFKNRPSAASFQSIDGAMLATSQQRFWEKYEILVTWFTGRSFTYPGDAFDGFRGVTDALERLSGEKFLWGHPRSRFGRSLYWKSPIDVIPIRCTESTSLPMTNLNTKVTFPSWSWLGWKGPAYCSVGDSFGDSETVEVLPFLHTSDPLIIHPVYTANRYDYTAATGNIKKDGKKPSAVPWKPVDNAVVTL